MSNGKTLTLGRLAAAVAVCIICPVEMEEAAAAVQRNL